MKKRKARSWKFRVLAAVLCLCPLLILPAMAGVADTTYYNTGILTTSETSK